MCARVCVCMCYVGIHTIINVNDNCAAATDDDADDVADEMLCGGSDDPIFGCCIYSSILRASYYIYLCVGHSTYVPHTSSFDYTHTHTTTNEDV